MKKNDIISYVVIILVVVLIRTFIATPIKVNGDSMNNTLKDGYLMILKKFDKKIERFDIVVVKYKSDKIIKRVIGLPKEDVKYENGKLYINDKEVKDEFNNQETKDFKYYCGDDEYFVMGDNRGNSLDSRIIGCVKRNDIMGSTDFVIFPFNKFGSVV